MVRPRPRQVNPPLVLVDPPERLKLLEDVRGEVGTRQAGAVTAEPVECVLHAGVKVDTRHIDKLPRGRDDRQLDGLRATGLTPLGV